MERKIKMPLLKGHFFVQILISVLSFFIGRSILFKILNPVAAGFLATLFGSGFSFYAAAAFTLAGIATKLKGIYLARYVLFILILSAANFIFRKTMQKNTRTYVKEPAQGLAGGLAMILGGLASAFVGGGFNTYIALISLMEGALIFLLVFILKKSTLVLYRKAKRPGLLRQEEMISLALLIGCFIAGASDIHVGEVSLRYFFCIYFAALLSYKGGGAMGAAGGMLCGFMLYISGYWDVSMPVVLGLAGMTGGFLRNYGKYASLTAFTLAGGLAIYYLNRPEVSFEMLYSAVLAGLLYSLTPMSFNFQLNAYVNPSLDNTADYIERIRDIAVHRLRHFAEAFEKLSGTFDGLSRKNAVKNHIPDLVDELGERVCGSCHRRNICWDENFYVTYQGVLRIFELCEKKVFIPPDIPEEELGCVNPKAVVDQANRIFAVHKANQDLSNSIEESRVLVSQQLAGLSSVIGNLADEIDFSLRFHEELEEKIMMELIEQRIDVDGAMVMEDRSGRFEVAISHKPYYERKPWSKTVTDILNRVLKKKMQMAEEEPVFAHDRYTTRFIEERRLVVNSGMARAAKNPGGESGDSFSYMELKNGQCMIALSDGMGSGRRAQEESAATVELLEDFIESGFEKDLAVRIINSALVLRSGDESFTTLDICSVDLYTGDAEFIKIGAATTFLRRNGKVTAIKSSSLPMGMLADVDIEASKLRLHHNDVILMITDGLLEVAGIHSKEEWIGEILRDCRYVNPQDIADTVLEEAKKQSRGIIRDDMTVLAARIWEKKV